MSEELDQSADIERSQNQIKYPNKIPWWTLVSSLLLAPISSFFIVLFITNLLNFISRENNPGNNVVWGYTIYIGGILGGLIGGIIVCWEIWMYISNNRTIAPPKILSPDLLYIGLLVLLTYILEFLSESLIFQGVFFILEVAIFIVIGRNISKYVLEKPDKQHSQLDSAPELES